MFVTFLSLWNLPHEIQSERLFNTKEYIQWRKKKSINGFVIKPVFYEITISDSDKVAYGLHFVF